MIRKILLVAFLGVALAAAAMFPSTNSGAARGVPDKGGRLGPLPDFDIRLVNKGEFSDYDLTSQAGRQGAAQNAAARARTLAVDHLRSGLRPDVAQNVRAVANDTGALKSLFIEGGALSAPRSDTADNIARGFLNRNTGLFALGRADVASLKLEKEDNDRGTVFLEYAQTVGDLKVYEGQVQVA